MRCHGADPACCVHTTDYHGVLKALGRTIDGDKPGYNPFTPGVKEKLKYRYSQDHGKDSVRKSGGKHSDAMVPQDHMVIVAKVLEEALALVSDATATKELLA
jgi:hypothetical protein